MADTNPLNLPTDRPAAAAPPTTATTPAPQRSLWRSWLGSSAPPPGQQSDSVREIVETIVFVVVLVLMLKSFAAEAFVIPTGSMAETLWGYQKVVECPECHVKFPVNCSQEVDPPDGGAPVPVLGCTCPNCRYHVQFYNPSEGRQAGRAADPGWNSGDRVLVSKFIYDLFGRRPERLDVVVFKYPGDDNFPMTGPHKAYVPMNYIKRLIGLPGETIAIHGGNLYILDPEDGPQYKDYEQAKQDPQQMALLWQKGNMHVDEARDPGLFPGKFHILRKPPDKILSTMRLVYDNDHPAPKQPVRWKGKGWSAEADHSFQADSSGDEQHWLRYHHLLRDTPTQPSLITDFLGYNSFEPSPRDTGHSARENWVSDLVLECEVVLDKPEGELTLELCKGVDRFQARFDLSSGVCSLYRLGEDRPMASQPTALHKKGTYRLRLANVDEQLTVWVDGRLPFEQQDVTYRPPSDTGPRADNDLEPAGIGVSRGAALTVRKVKLFRDIYYTTEEIPSRPDVANVDFCDPGTWGKLSDLPKRTYYVQPDHFLCLGDNSQESSDGRTWGLVPRRLMLGRALMVYYPLSRAGRIH